MRKLIPATILETMNVLKIINTMSIWKFLTTEDMKELKEKLPNDLYWKLSHQCRARIPLLKTSYNILKKKYGSKF